jgi:hypothetical protein
MGPHNEDHNDTIDEQEGKRNRQAYGKQKQKPGKKEYEEHPPFHIIQPDYNSSGMGISYFYRGDKSFEM